MKRRSFFLTTLLAPVVALFKPVPKPSAVISPPDTLWILDNKYFKKFPEIEDTECISYIGARGNGSTNVEFMFKLQNIMLKQPTKHGIIKNITL